MPSGVGWGWEPAKGVDLGWMLSGALQGCWMGLRGAEPALPMLMGGSGDFSRAMLQGLAYNSHVSDLHLDLSGCEVREGTRGCHGSV